MKKKIRAIITSVGLAYTKWLCRNEFEMQQHIPFNERSIEFAFLFKSLTKIWPSTILDVGTGTTALPHLLRNCGYFVTATDNVKDYWSSGMVNRHYYVIDDDIKNTKISGTFDFISCISVLEHIVDHSVAIASMIKLLNPGGHLMISFPYSEEKYIENVYLLPQSPVGNKYPFPTQSLSRKEVDSWCQENDICIVEQQYWNFFTGDYWTCGDRLAKPTQALKNERHQMSCILFKKA